MGALLNGRAREAHVGEAASNRGQNLIMKSRALEYVFFSCNDQAGPKTPSAVSVTHQRSQVLGEFSAGNECHVQLD